METVDSVLSQEDNDRAILLYGYYLHYARMYDADWIRFCQETKSKFVKERPTSSKKTIGCLPEVMLLLIFGYLDSSSLCRSSAVSKDWSSAANKEFHWERLCVTRFNVRKIGIHLSGRNAKYMYRCLHTTWKNIIYKPSLDVPRQLPSVVLQFMH